MHPRIFARIDAICRERRVAGHVLEIGATPTDDSLIMLPALAAAKSRVGVSLDPPTRHRGCEIVQADANLLPFPDRSFDAILCNSMLEHDRRFWLTIAEMRRVAARGATIIIGTPAYDRCTPATVFPLLRLLRLFGQGAAWVDGSLSLPIHEHPHDYYRFSRQAFADVFLEGLEDVSIESLLMPPRLVGVGRMPASRPAHSSG